MGRWKGTVEQTDIGYPHLRITDSLAFVGVQLQASWVKSRKENNDILVERLRSTINSWKSGKFMSLVSRPFSVNSFALSKVWFRTHIVDLRAQDINSISSVCKGYIYQDMLEKPAEVVLFRNAEQGGLGMHHIKCKAMASLITTFIQTAISNKFRRSLYHNSLFRYYCQDDRSLPKPDQPPYYSDVFFELIKKVLTDTPMNPAQMTLKQWYYHLLEELVTHEVRDGQRVQIQCRVEMLNPSNDWSKSFHLSRLKGLSSQIRSFLFKLLHQILPVRDRLNHILRNTNPVCILCEDEQPETLLHALFSCRSNRAAAEALLSLVRPYDHSITPQKVLLLDINCEPIYQQSVVMIMYTGLYHIWENRIKRKTTSLYQVRSELECLISLLRRSRSKYLREAGRMIFNTLENFPI